MKYSRCKLVFDWKVVTCPKRCVSIRRGIYTRRAISAAAAVLCDIHSISSSLGLYTHPLTLY
jgi:hypothetical protein